MLGQSDYKGHAFFYTREVLFTCPVPQNSYFSCRFCLQKMNPPLVETLVKFVLFDLFQI
jgi:hypothetical protein